MSPPLTSRPRPLPSPLPGRCRRVRCHMQQVSRSSAAKPPNRASRSARSASAMPTPASSPSIAARPTTRSSASSSRTRSCGPKRRSSRRFADLKWMTRGATAQRRRACRRCSSKPASATCSTPPRLRRRRQAHPPRQAGRRIAAAISPHPRSRREAEAARADGLHVPLQPRRRAAPRVPQGRLAGRRVRGPRGHEQGRPADRAQGAGRVSAAGSCSSWAATSSTWSSASSASPIASAPYPRALAARRRPARQHARRLRLPAGDGHGEIHAHWKWMAVRPPALRRLRHGGHVPHPAARYPASGSRSTGIAANTRKGTQEIRFDPVHAATSPTPPTWPGSSAARRRPTFPTPTTSPCKKRCSWPAACLLH